MASSVMRAQVYVQERLRPGHVSWVSWKRMHRIAQPAPSPVCVGKLARGVLQESMPACIIMLLHSHSKGSPLSHVCWVFQLHFKQWAPGDAGDTSLQQKHTKTICQGQQGKPPRYFPKTNTYTIEPELSCRPWLCRICSGTRISKGALCLLEMSFKTPQNVGSITQRAKAQASEAYQNETS